jgi:hypothetical protein
MRDSPFPGLADQRAPREHDKGNAPMRSIPLCPTIAAAALLATFACAGAPPGEGGSDGLPAGATRLTEDLRIGVTEGADEYLFGRIGYIVQHTDGTIFIADTQVPIIRRYDAQGVFMHTVGGEGEGPGEYRDIQGMKLAPDGNLAIWDVQIRRITVFRPDGAWIRDFPGDSGIHTSALTFQTDHQGNFYLYTTIRPGGMRINPTTREVQQGPPPVNGFHKYSPDGELLETIEMPSDESDTPGYVLSTPAGFLHNFTTRTDSTISSFGNVVVGQQATYALEFRDSGGNVLFAVEHNWEPVPLEAEERAQWTAWNEYTQRRIAEMNMEEEYAPIPATKPAFMELWPGENGTIWVRRYAAAHERERPPRPAGDERPQLTWFQYPTWDVFASEGEFLGAVELPYDTRPVFMTRDYIWTIQPNEDEEDVAVRYRIEGLGGS